MGHAINKQLFNQEAYQAFSDKLQDDLTALKMLLERPDFGIGPPTIGAEIEFYIVDDDGRVLPINKKLIRLISSTQLQEEISRFSIELNLKPQQLAAQPFHHMEQEIQSHWQQLNEAAKVSHGKLITIGILPTLNPEFFTKNNRMMTASDRYKILSNHLKKKRNNETFEIKIDGVESLNLHVDDVTIAGATTSFQLHWRVNPSEFADCFNAIQLFTPLAVGISANSPILFGKKLWEETRIPLFEQATNCFISQQNHWQHPSHVSFGEGWVREGAWELFAEVASIYPPLLPICDDKENPIEIVKQGGIPSLSELRLHQGTRWMWNRAIYDPQCGGHLRIEIRALPAGPSCADQSASAAFLLGLAKAYKHRIREKIAMMPFSCAKHNFYQAAKYGFDAVITWPCMKKNRLREYHLSELANLLLPEVEWGLKELNINAFEIHRLMQILEKRIHYKINGAQWQRKTLDHFRKETNNIKANQLMLDFYHKQQQTGKPITEWDIAD